jgi:ribosomal protein S18 acetylase RimI-like enzyme
VHPLDNPAWHALTGPQATVAEARARATRYDPAVAPFVALPDDPTAASWDDLADLVGPGEAAVLFRAAVAAPEGWEELFRIPAVQMVAASVAATDAADAVVLGAADVPDMLALAGRTHPGPFERRTIELGEYLGIRHGGRLVAMAGERMRLPGHTEISAVCTDPSARRRGLASRLVAGLATRIAARGDTPILHVVAENTPAISVYERLGFASRLAFDVVGVRCVSPPRALALGPRSR